ncbi:MAG TPA: DUF2157 domain-containing protein [Lutibacter sp.]
MLKNLQELIKADVISQNTADNISDFYRIKGEDSTNRLFVVFGIIGAILVGLGIIMSIAHNWDQLSKITKTFFAFSSLLAGQFLEGFVDKGDFNKRNCERKTTKQ